MYSSYLNRKNLSLVTFIVFISSSMIFFQNCGKQQSICSKTDKNCEGSAASTDAPVDGASTGSTTSPPPTGITNDTQPKKTNTLLNNFVERPTACLETTTNGEPGEPMMENIGTSSSEELVPMLCIEYYDIENGSSNILPDKPSKVQTTEQQAATITHKIFVAEGGSFQIRPIVKGGVPPYKFIWNNVPTNTNNTDTPYNRPIYTDVATAATAAKLYSFTVTDSQNKKIISESFQLQTKSSPPADCIVPPGRFNTYFLFTITSADQSIGDKLINPAFDYLNYKDKITQPQALLRVDDSLGGPIFNKYYKKFFNPVNNIDINPIGIQVFNIGSDEKLPPILRSILPQKHGTSVGPYCASLGKDLKINGAAGSEDFSFKCESSKMKIIYSTHNVNCISAPITTPPP